jgi:RND superfamily putative drug exporter
MWSYRRRRVVVVLWVIALIGLSVLSQAFGADKKDDFALPGADSQRAYDLLSKRFPSNGGDIAQIVVQSQNGVDQPVTRTTFENLLAEIAKQPHVVAIDTPYDEQLGASLRSQDGRIAEAIVHFNQRAAEVPSSVAKHILDEAKAAKIPDGKIVAGGPALQKGEQEAPGGAETIGLIAAMIILLVAFGSFLAALFPILTAVFGVGIGIALIGFFAHLMSVPSFAPQVATMVGIGVGIDYALLIVTRHRDSLQRGHDPKHSLRIAASTAGRSVAFAGTVVVISLMGLFVMNFAIVRGVAISASSAVLVTMLAAVTLLPALLGFAGMKMAKVRFQRHRDDDEGRMTLSYRWSRVVQRRPVPAAIIATAILVFLALPLFGMRLGTADAGNNPKHLQSRQAYDLLAQAFGPGSNGTVIVAVDLSKVAPTTRATVVPALTNAFAQTPNVARVIPPRLNAAGDAVVIIVVPKSAPQDAATDQLVHRLRNVVVPSAIAGTGAVAHVGGITASFTDFADRIGKRLPVLIAVVITFSFLLLMVVFRSLLVPLKAAVMNLLSIGAAYGVIVAVFQDGHFGSLFGVDRTGPIEAWVPMMMFAVLFGLSMDYEVFLLSRIREEYLRTHDNRQAVADGLARTARVITAAALIMIAVFSSFVLGDLRVLKLLGLGLATAVFVDATIVRMVLVPATMELLGDANWWLPKWLDRRLPHLDVDGSAIEDTPPLAAPPREPVRV